MKVVIQRVKNAKVEVEGEITGEISKGLLLLVCLEKGDDQSTIEKACKKILALRIFEDENGKMNQNVQQIGGEILSVSQFTLSWDGRKGNRPSFENSMAPDMARLNYALFNKYLRDQGVSVAEGRFAASMQVSLLNDGPVTFHLDF
jgi:D-tyrosyl-tRNA(Tyr) deacylase